MRPKNYIFVVFKVYLSASIVTAMDILELLNTFSNNLPFCVAPILSTLAAKIWSRILQPHLGQGRPPSLPPSGIPKVTQPFRKLLIYCVAG